MADKKIYEYPGKQINVTWDGRLCIHVAECGQAEGELFVGGRDPWCQPDLTTVEDTIDVVQRCPSGALAWRLDDGSMEQQAPAQNSVQLVNDGPLYLSGELAIEAATDDMPATRFRAALCRCGASANKPFCDGSHRKAGFEDSGACGQTGDCLEDCSGELSVTTVKDGPLLLKGRFRIIAASGRVAWSGEQAGLCRCGKSNNKPFCDGSHKAAGFKAD